MRKVYAFISYNRKVIIPAPTTDTHTLQPTFRLRYRLAYLLFTVIVISWICTAAPIRISTTLAITTGQLLFQSLFITAYAPKKTWDYLGNLMTISLAGTLLLLPMILSHPDLFFFTGYCAFVAALTLFEHNRRTKLLRLGGALTITWISYWVLILILLQLRHQLF